MAFSMWENEKSPERCAGEGKWTGTQCEEEESLRQKLSGSSQMDTKPRYTLSAALKHLECPIIQHLIKESVTPDMAGFKKCRRGRYIVTNLCLGSSTFSSGLLGSKGKMET